MTIVIQCKTIYYPEAIALRGGRIEQSLVTSRYLVFCLMSVSHVVPHTHLQRDITHSKSNLHQHISGS